MKTYPGSDLQVRLLGLYPGSDLQVRLYWVSVVIIIMNTKKAGSAELLFLKIAPSKIIFVTVYLCGGNIMLLSLPVLSSLSQYLIIQLVLARVYNEERVSNAPLPYRKHSRESNVIVTRPKTARYDVYTLIKTGIDRRRLLPPLPMSSRNPQ